MSLVIIGDNLRVGTSPAHIQIYSDISLNYTRVLSIEDFTNYTLSSDRRTITILPSSELVGSFSLRVLTEAGSISVPIEYLDEYHKDTSLVNTVDRYYPRDMFKWNDSSNPKTAEPFALNKIIFGDPLYPDTSIHFDLRIKVPLLQEFHKNWSSYCSSQLMGVAMQLALAEFDAGNDTTIVVWEEILGTVSSKEDFLGTTPTQFIPDPDSTTIPKKASVNSSRFPCSSSTLQPTGLTEPDHPAYIGGIVRNFPTPATTPPEHPFGLYFTPYKPEYSPLKYKEIRVTEGAVTKDYQLRYGAVKNSDDTLKYVKSNKVVYVGQSVPLVDDYFQFDNRTGTSTEGKGFNNPHTNPPSGKGGKWFDGGSGQITTLLSTWEDIQGMPASNEVIYDRTNIDISELDTTVTIPPYSRMLTGEQDFIEWFGKYSRQVTKIALKYTGTDFIVQFASDDVYFTIAGTPVGKGLDEGILFS